MRFPAPTARADKTDLPADSSDSQTWGMPRHCSASGATPGAGRSPLTAPVLPGGTAHSGIPAGGGHTAIQVTPEATLQPVQAIEATQHHPKLLAPAGQHCWGRACRCPASPAGLIALEVVDTTGMRVC